MLSIHIDKIKIIKNEFGFWFNKLIQKIIIMKVLDMK